MKTLRTSVVGIASALVLLAAPALTLACDRMAQAATGDQAADTESAPKAAADCPYSDGEKCCATCQEKLKQGEPVDQATGDCPCKRAKEMRQGS